MAQAVWYAFLILDKSCRWATVQVRCCWNTLKIVPLASSNQRLCPACASVLLVRSIRDFTRFSVSHAGDMHFLRDHWFLFCFPPFSGGDSYDRSDDYNRSNNNANAGYDDYNGGYWATTSLSSVAHCREIKVLWLERSSWREGKELLLSCECLCELTLLNAHFSFVKDMTWHRTLVCFQCGDEVKQ